MDDRVCARRGGRSRWSSAAVLGRRGEIAAALTSLATVRIGGHSLVARPDPCIGKLRAMMATASAPDWDDVHENYQQLPIDYAGIEL